MKHTHGKHIRTRFWPILECREMSKLITASMDGKLAWRERLMMKLHLLACDPCANFLKQVTFIRTALGHAARNLGEYDEAISLSPDARHRIKSALATARAV